MSQPGDGAGDGMIDSLKMLLEMKLQEVVVGDGTIFKIFQSHAWSLPNCWFRARRWSGLAFQNKNANSEFLGHAQDSSDSALTDLNKSTTCEFRQIFI